MGAQLWHHAGPWRADPAESLFDIQVRVLRDEYDFPRLLREHLEGAREAVRATEQDDTYNLLDFYREEVARLEELAALPPPKDSREEIGRVRVLYSSSGEGIGSILDVTHVSKAGGMHVARRLPAGEIRRLCGTDRPAKYQAIAAVAPINRELGPGDSVCFPYYSTDGSEPLGWYFVGNTID